MTVSYISFTPKMFISDECNGEEDMTQTHHMSYISSKDLCLHNNNDVHTTACNESHIVSCSAGPAKKTQL